MIQGGYDIKIKLNTTNKCVIKKEKLFFATDSLVIYKDTIQVCLIVETRFIKQFTHLKFSFKYVREQKKLFFLQ